MTNLEIAYGEVYQIINMLEEEYYNRIPKKVIKFFKDERAQDYEPNIDISVPLEKQGLKKDTFTLLTILDLYYLCDSKQEKEEIMRELQGKSNSSIIPTPVVEEVVEDDDITNKFITSRVNANDSESRKRILEQLSRNNELEEYNPRNKAIDTIKNFFEKIINLFKNIFERNKEEVENKGKGRRSK